MRLVTWLIGLVALALVGVGGYFYWRHSALYPSTDDAYIGAHVARIAAQVSGQVTEVNAHNQEPVKAGQTLFLIKQDTFQAKVAAAKARLTMARQAVDAQAAAVTAAQAAVHNQEVLLANARSKAARAVHMVATGGLSKQSGEDAQAAVQSGEAQLLLAKARLHQARMELGGSGTRNARVQEAQAQLDEARIDLANTRVTAPCDGQVEELTLRPGDVVSSGKPLFALICAQTFWVDANFKETDLERIRIGQPVNIDVDNYPGHAFHGRVESISGASGVAFSLLPPENATGNWVKVTQRVPVRILVSDPNAAFPLRVGTSASVTVDTVAHAGSLAVKSHRSAPPAGK